MTASQPQSSGPCAAHNKQVCHNCAQKSWIEKTQHNYTPKLGLLCISLLAYSSTSALCTSARTSQSQPSVEGMGALSAGRRSSFFTIVWIVLILTIGGCSRTSLATSSVDRNRFCCSQLTRSATPTPDTLRTAEQRTGRWNGKRGGWGIVEREQASR